MKSILAIALLFSASCSDDVWSLQRSESFVNERRNAFDVLCLSPQIEYQTSELNSDTKAIEKLSKSFYRSIRRSAKRNGVPLDIKSLNKDAGIEYYEKLLPLKNDIVAANFNSGLYSYGRTIEDELCKSVYVYPPKIPLEYNDLSKHFNTKYFSHLKIIIRKDAFTFYHVMVDTDLGETVYNERKNVNRKYNSDLCEQVVYDSFNILAKELKNKK